MMINYYCLALALFIEGCSAAVKVIGNLDYTGLETLMQEFEASQYF